MAAAIAVAVLTIIYAPALSFKAVLGIISAVANATSSLLNAINKGKAGSILGIIGAAASFGTAVLEVVDAAKKQAVKIAGKLKKAVFKAISTGASLASKILTYIGDKAAGIALGIVSSISGYINEQYRQKSGNDGFKFKPSVWDSIKLGRSLAEQSATLAGADKLSGYLNVAGIGEDIYGFAKGVHDQYKLDDKDKEKTQNLSQRDKDRKHRDLAVARLTDTQFEYEWFETSGPLSFSRSGFEEKYAEYTNQGYSLVEHTPLVTSCRVTSVTGVNGEALSTDQDCTYADRFFVERAKGVEAAGRLKLAKHIPRLKAPPIDSALTEEINDYLRIGLYPTHALSKYEILLQPPAPGNQISGGDVKLQVVTGGGKKVQRRVNELAQQGYRLAPAPPIPLRDDLAVMEKRNDPAPPVSYAWVYTLSKTFEQELARLQEKGAIYRTAIPEKVTLIFELPGAGGGRRREYKVLMFELNEVEVKASRKFDFDLTPASKENVKTLNRLVKDGFEVREVFRLSAISDYHRVGLLLERPR